MIPRDKRQAPQRGLLETYLEDILNTRHELVQLGKRIDWSACEQYFGQLYAVQAGRPELPIRLHVGLQLLKHMYALSDRDVLDRWVENPYWQHFCGEVIFQHRLPMDETTMMRFLHQALAGNPYDGHTVDTALKRVLLHTGKMPEHLLADRGYRGSESTFLSKIHITGKRRGRGKAHPDQQHRRRSLQH